MSTFLDLPLYKIIGREATKRKYFNARFPLLKTCVFLTLIKSDEDFSWPPQLAFAGRPL